MSINPMIDLIDAKNLRIENLEAALAAEREKNQQLIDGIFATKTVSDLQAENTRLREGFRHCTNVLELISRSLESSALFPKAVESLNLLLQELNPQNTEGK